ncbi:MAG: glucose-1-phosphate thymidylyltransferase, partial [Muribaculaceae bacterium]|nr:glucose-1-phosphate thymidylyltransferase [Muribaculaceae bacterium]
MRHIIIYDQPEVRAELLPMTYTRPVGALRLGIDTIAEKWQSVLPGKYSWLPAADYLKDIYEADEEARNGAGTLFIAGNVLPDPGLVGALEALAPGQKLIGRGGQVIARCGAVSSREVEYDSEITAVNKLYDIFMLNAAVIESDFRRLTAGRESAPLSASNTVVGDPSLVFLEEGATVEGAFINTVKGPVYVGRDAEIMEGAMLRGPIAVCEHATVNMGAKIYGGTTVGPWCKVGGEVNNVVFFGYSNKAHDGFLGNAVIGEWCNLGAGSVASNLKNDYTPIRLWNYPARRFEPTGLQFCGLIMGD